jgi:hypothetical protein
MWIAVALALPLGADNRNQEPLNSTHTERFNVPAAGAIRLENSFGEVDIDGWDRPEVEVTVVRSSERGEALGRLDSVQIAAKQSGNDVVISTTYPPRNGFLHPLSRRSDIQIGYRIKAPRGSKLIVDHNSGGLNVSGISGDIHATVINGQITLALGAEGQYAIDAQCKVGGVYSDFEGRDRPRHWFGEEFESQSGAPAANLYLRVRVGDIVITKLHGPPAD